MKYVIVILTLIACQTKNITSSPGEMSTMLTKDSIRTKAGEQFTISIRASLGSGNRWMLHDSLDKQYIRLVSIDTKTDSVETAPRPDIQYFVFKALKPGESRISFIYKRPWKKEDDPNAEKKDYAIIIIP